MGIVEEFKTFALKGNMVDLAIGVIIGAAFSKVVSSLVADVIMPPLGLLIGGLDFSNYQIVLRQATANSPAVILKYGSLINALLDFMIVSMAIFSVVKGMNRLKKQKPVEPGTKVCTECLMAIPVKAKKCCHCSSLQN